MPFQAIINAFNNDDKLNQEKITQSNTENQFQLQQQAAAQGQNLFDYHVQNYRPLEQQAIQMASDAGSPEQQEVQAGMAGSQVQKSFTNASDARRRQQEMLGSKPDAMNVQEQDRQDQIAQAGATAGAMNLARQNERSYGLSAKTAVADVGRNITSNAIGAENAASNAAAVGLKGSQQASDMNRQNLSDIGAAAGAIGGIYNQLSSNSQSGQQPDYTGGTGTFTGGGAGSQTDEFGNSYDSRDNSTPLSSFSEAFRKGGIVKPPRNYAGGGKVTGPGTGTSDSVPVMIDGKTPGALSNGEYVINTAAVKKAGLKKLDRINLAGLPKGSKMHDGRHLADGGKVDADDDDTQDDDDSTVTSGAYARGGAVRKSFARPQHRGVAAHV